MKFASILVCSFFIFFGCQKKEAGDTTTVTFTMPDLSGYGTQNIYQRVASAPATIDEVNCFAVMVSGPEPFLSRTSCPVIDSTSTSVASQKNVGLVKGLIRSGGTLTFNVPAGIQRQFTLLGVKANPLTACMDFSNPDLSQDYTSQLFIVGESLLVDLQPGTEVNVPIKLPITGTAFSSSSPRIGECSGPDSPSGRGRILPTKALVIKDQFPYNTLKYNSCNQINVTFLDEDNKNGPTIATQNIKVERAEIIGGSVGTYTSLAGFTNPDCTGSLPSEISIPANTRNFPIYFYSSASASATALVFKVKPGVNAPVSTYPETTSAIMPIEQSSTTGIEVFGARRVIQDMCYNMIGFFKTTGLSPASGSAYTPSYADVEGRIFPEKFCTNTMITSGTAYAITPDEYFNFSMKFTPTAATRTYFSLLPTTSGTNMTLNYDVQVVGGSVNPTFLRPELPPYLPANSPGCYGPFQVLVENEKGAAVVTDGSIVVSFPAGMNHPDVSIFNNNLCNQNYASNFFDDYRRVYYIGVSSTAVAANTNLGLRAVGQIDHPSYPGNATYSVSLTTTTNLLFK